jgi:hypothetical protein
MLQTKKSCDVLLKLSYFKKEDWGTYSSLRRKNFASIAGYFPSDTMLLEKNCIFKGDKMNLDKCPSDSKLKDVVGVKSNELLDVSDKLDVSELLLQACIDDYKAR